jgi:hypothetical protein
MCHKFLSNLFYKLFLILLQIKMKYTQAIVLMFVSCIIRHSRNNQHYELICTTPLFYILAVTYFGSNLPSSGSFLDPSELLEIQIEWVVYHIMCGYVTCVPECHGSVCCASPLSAHGWKPQQMEPRHSGTQAT